MKLRFTKMHGLGNDFVVIDGINQVVKLNNKQLARLADRHFGVGCDQILLVETSDRNDVDFRYRIFNADGGEVEQCGNGARCFARFVLEKKLTDKHQIAVETQKGIIYLDVVDANWVKVNMGVPVLTPADIPIATMQQELHYHLTVDSHEVAFGAVSMGNPHAVMLVDDVQTAPVKELGRVLEPHQFFPQKANIGFLQIENRNKGKLRVFERGVGETLACGSGACAAMVIGRLWEKFDDTVVLSLPGGDLQIEWKGEATPVFMSGPAEFVYEGEIDFAD